MGLNSNPVDREWAENEQQVSVTNTTCYHNPDSDGGQNKGMMSQLTAAENAFSLLCSSLAYVCVAQCKPLSAIRHHQTRPEPEDSWVKVKDPGDTDSNTKDLIYKNTL